MVARFKLALVGVAVAAGVVSSLGALSARETQPVSAEPVVTVSLASNNVVTTQPAVQQSAPDLSCAKQAWPYVTADCIAAAQGTPARQVRQISLRAN